MEINVGTVIMTMHRPPKPWLTGTCDGVFIVERAASNYNVLRANDITQQT